MRCQNKNILKQKLIIFFGHGCAFNSMLQDKYEVFDNKRMEFLVV